MCYILNEALYQKASRISSGKFAPFIVSILYSITIPIPAGYIFHTIEQKDAGHEHVYCTQSNRHHALLFRSSSSFLELNTHNTSFPSKVRVSCHIHSFSILSDDRSKASSKTMPPYSAMQSLLLQMRIFSPVLKVIQ